MKVTLPIKIINVVLAVLFVVFAWFQRNDIDPQIYHNASSLDAAMWLLFYLVIAALLIVVIWRRIPLWLLVICVIACLVELALTGPGLYQNLFGKEDFTMMQQSMSAEDPRVELSREFFGAVLALAGVVWVGVQHRRQ